MKCGRQRVHSNRPRSSCGICICGKRKLVLPNFFWLWRKDGPPPSSRQYQSANTITFVSQRSPPERSSCDGDSRCVGSARTRRMTEPISASVVIPLIMIPRVRFNDCPPEGSEELHTNPWITLANLCTKLQLRGPSLHSG